ncbi:GNAT family N-acetyltransferase [Propionibacteriaceae bacterium Y2011]
MRRRVFRSAAATRIFAALVILGGIAAIAGLGLLWYRQLGSPAIIITLMVLALLGILYLWRFALHPKVVFDRHLWVHNPMRTHVLDADEVHDIVPGRNGLQIRHDDGVVEAWCVQKSDRAIHRHKRTRADKVTETLLVLLDEATTKAPAKSRERNRVRRTDRDAEPTTAFTTRHDAAAFDADRDHPLRGPVPDDAPTDMTVRRDADEVAMEVDDTIRVESERADRVDSDHPASPVPTASAVPADSPVPADSAVPAASPIPPVSAVSASPAAPPPAPLPIDGLDDATRPQTAGSAAAGSDHDEDDDLIIRRANADDLATLVRLEQQVNGAALSHVLGPEPFPTGSLSQTWRDVLADRRVKVRVAELDGHPVGYLAFDKVRIRHLGILPERARWTHSRELMSYATDQIFAHGSPRASLNVLEDNTGAREHYRMLGWRETGERTTCPHPPHPPELTMVLDQPLD